MEGEGTKNLPDPQALLEAKTGNNAGFGRRPSAPASFFFCLLLLSSFSGSFLVPFFSASLLFPLSLCFLPGSPPVSVAYRCYERRMKLLATKYTTLALREQSVLLQNVELEG
jgi:hypothetical protein